MGCGCGKNKASNVQPTAAKTDKKTKIVKVVNGKKYTYYV